MGCKGSKHVLLDGAGCGPRAPEPRRSSGLVPRHSVALRSSTLGTLSLDRATAAAAAVSFGGAEGAAITKSAREGSGGGVAGRCRSTRWFPASSPATDEPAKRQRPRTPTKTPARDPEEINVWELMEGLDDDDGVLLRSAAGSPEFDSDVLSAFRDALAEFSPPPDAAVAPVNKEEIQVFAGVVRARLDAFQQRIDGAKSGKNPPPPPPPESARRVVLYLTSLRGVRQTYEDCWAAATILSGYGVRVDERDLSMHAGYKDELRDALGGTGRLPQVFVDGWHLGGAEEVRRMHESGELGEALEACEPALGAAGGWKEGSGLPAESCGGCGGARFVPCGVCSGSCKVFVGEEDGAGAFRRCPDCNENGLVRCPIC
jgi:glutaredoxin domain-containing cysteine-rich protein 1